MGFISFWLWRNTQDHHSKLQMHKKRESPLQRGSLGLFGLFGGLEKANNFQFKHPAVKAIEF